MRAMLLALLCQGCAIPPDPWGESAITVKGDDQFKARVSLAVARWDEALYARCGHPVIRIVEEGGRPVYEVPVQEWLDRGYGNGTLGMFEEDRISIRASISVSWTNVILHELGHSLGLDHSDPTVDRESVMSPFCVSTIVYPSGPDIDAAADALGCP